MNCTERFVHRNLPRSGQQPLWYRSLPLAGCRVIILLALDVHDVRDVGQGKAMGRNTGFGGRDDSGNSTLP